MAEGYYYIVSSLPMLSLSDRTVEHDMLSFREWATPQMRPIDAAMLKVIFYPYDLINVSVYLTNHHRPYEEAGNFPVEDWEGMIMDTQLAPPFIQAFIDEEGHKWKKEDYKYVLNKVSSHFVDWCRDIKNPFLNEWLRFEHNLKNLLIHLNAHKFQLDPHKEIVGNYREAKYLKSTDRKELNLKSWDFRYREVLSHYDNKHISLRERILNEMKWNYLSELESNYPFGLERILAYAIKLQIINRNIYSSEEKGRQRLDEILYNIRKDYTMPDVFA